jgi:hypothetical protein
MSTTCGTWITWEFQGLPTRCTRLEDGNHMDNHKSLMIVSNTWEAKENLVGHWELISDFHVFIAHNSNHNSYGVQII